MLDELDVAIKQASDKVSSGRVYDADNESVRIQWVRALGYLMRTKRQILDGRGVRGARRAVSIIENLPLMTRKSSDRDIEAELERLRSARRAKDLRADETDRPTRELSDRQKEHIDAIISDARAENPEALREAERELDREREQQPESRR